MKKELQDFKKILIVVDMVNGFIREGKMADPKIAGIIPENIRLIELFLSEGEGLAFVKDSHDLDAREFKRYPVHCLRGTSEAELVDELKPYEEDVLVYQKNSTSTIFADNFLNDIDRMKELKEIVITGCCTDICIENLANPLQNYFDQFKRDVEITVPMNAVDTYGSPTHDRDEYNDRAFVSMNNAGIKLVKNYGGKNGK